MARASPELPTRASTVSGCAAIMASSVRARPIVLLPTSRASARMARRERRSTEKIKALLGGPRRAGRRSQSYSLPQIVGETGGMRGGTPAGHLSSRNFGHCVARVNLSLLLNPTRGSCGSRPRDRCFRLPRIRSRFRASKTNPHDRDQRDEETSGYGDRVVKKSIPRTAEAALLSPRVLREWPVQGPPVAVRHIGPTLADAGVAGAPEPRSRPRSSSLVREGFLGVLRVFPAGRFPRRLRASIGGTMR